MSGTYDDNQAGGDFIQAAADIADKNQMSINIIDGVGHGDNAFETVENIEAVLKFLDQYLRED